MAGFGFGLSVPQEPEPPPELEPPPPELEPPPPELKPPTPEEPELRPEELGLLDVGELRDELELLEKLERGDEPVLRGATVFPDELGFGDVDRMPDWLFGRLLTVPDGVEFCDGVDALPPGGGFPVPAGGP